jgi:hypothetical protein
VAQTIVLDWYDGPLGGFCRLHTPAAELELVLLDERHNPDGIDVRLFRVGVLPAGTFEAVLGSLRFAGPPTTPVWAPIWRSEVPGELEAADRAVAAARAAVVPTSLVVSTTDFVAFSACWQVAPGDLARVTDWFTHLGLASP